MEKMGVQFTHPVELHSGHTMDDVILVYSNDRTTFFQTVTSDFIFQEVEVFREARQAYV